MGRHAASNITCTISWPRSRTSISTIREVQDALLETVRFWLERGVDGFRLDTINFYFHDRKLRRQSAAAAASATPASRRRSIPTASRSISTTRRSRRTSTSSSASARCSTSIGGRAAVGEVGDEGRSLATVADYTSGGDKLHMCYTFDLLGPQFSAAHVRGCVERLRGSGRRRLVCWAFSNHDVVRHVIALGAAGRRSRHASPSSRSTLLMSLRGSICLYQGEELGLEEAELAFEDLRDPYGIRFWPAFKGRDGCRTPMVWEAAQPNAGFSTGKPWLPVPEAHRRRAVDVEQGEPGLGARALSPGAGVPPSAPGAGCRHDRIPRRRGDVLAFVRAAATSGCFASSTLPATRPNGSSRLSWVSRKSSKGLGVVRASRARSLRSTRYRPASRGSARRGRMLPGSRSILFVPASAVTVS